MTHRDTHEQQNGTSKRGLAHARERGREEAGGRKHERGREGERERKKGVGGGSLAHVCRDLLIFVTTFAKCHMTHSDL